MDESQAPLTLWAIVKISDDPDLVSEKNKNKKQLVSISMHPHWSAKEVQMALLKAVGIGHAVPSSTHKIVKVRDAHGALLPLTPITLQSSPIQPLVLEVCTAHQHVKAEESEVDALPPSFKTAVEAIVKRFEKRLATVEAGLEGLESRRAALVEEELRRIQETLAFMSRRLDLTRAPTWVTGQT